MSKLCIVPVLFIPLYKTTISPKSIHKCHSEEMLLNFLLVALTTVNAYKFMPDSMGAAPTDYVSENKSQLFQHQLFRTI